MPPAGGCRIVFSISLLLCLTPRLQAQTSAERLDTAAILASARPDIDAANAAWVPGLQHRDAQAIVAAYADSGLFINADGSVTRGRAAIAVLYAARFPRIREVRSGGVIQEGLTAVSPTLVYEWGHAWLDLVGVASDKLVHSDGKYLTVWQRGADHRWHITRNIAF